MTNSTFTRNKITYCHVVVKGIPNGLKSNKINKRRLNNQTLALVPI